MMYPYKYPELYAEAARQGRRKKELASVIGITLAGLRYKQSLDTSGDFGGDEMKKLATYLEKPADVLFSLGNGNSSSQKNEVA